MFLFSKHQIHVTKIITQSIITFWHFVHQQSVPRSKYKQNTLNVSVPIAVLLNLDKKHLLLLAMHKPLSVFTTNQELS